MCPSLRTHACDKVWMMVGHTYQAVMHCELLQNILNILHEALWYIAQPCMGACHCA